MKAARQKFPNNAWMLWYDHPDGGLIFVVASDGSWNVFDDDGWSEPDDPRQGQDDIVLVRGFGHTWLKPMFEGGAEMVWGVLGWPVANEEKGESNCQKTGDAWELWFGGEYYALYPPEPEPELELPPLPIVPPPFAGFTRPPELVLFPSGKMRDMAFCVGADPVEQGVVKVRWAYGYYIKVHEGEITLCGETIEHMSGEDAAAFRIAWHLRQGHVVA